MGTPLGQMPPATWETVRGWLCAHWPDGNAEFALKGCTGWNYLMLKGIQCR
jgi:transposase